MKPLKLARLLRLFKYLLNLLILGVLTTPLPQLLTPLHAQAVETTPRNNTPIVPAEATPVTKTKKNQQSQLFFLNDINILLYFNHNQAVEITGNESTFTTALNLAFDGIRLIQQAWSIRFRSDLYIMESLSLKGRLYENFNPPPLLFEELFVDMAYHSSTHDLITSLKFGIFSPLTQTFPMHNYHLPIVYKTSPYDSNFGKNLVAEDLRELGHASITGNRDDPLGMLVLNRFDTGLLYRLYVLGFEFGVSLSNGEEGLDPNSAKTVSTRLAFSNQTLHTGFNAQIGNIGSVPIKETKHFYQYFLYFTSKGFQTDQKRDERYRFPHKNTTAYHTTQPAPLQFQVGLEAMLHLHGLRYLNLINLEDGSLNTDEDGVFTWLGNSFTNLADFFGFVDGYFSPFAVFNNGSYDARSQLNPDILYGLSFLIFAELRYQDFFSLATHFSGYDPNLLSEGNEMYTLRYRGFLRIGFHLKDFLSFYISTTYTHDALHLNWAQFFEREPRDLHFIRDYSIYAGFVYYIGR